MVDASRTPSLENQRRQFFKENKESLLYRNEQKATSCTDNTKGARDKVADKFDSRISNIITQSFLEKEKAFLKNPGDYDKISEVNFIFYNRKQVV